jgi:hypothetical protein
MTQKPPRSGNPQLILTAAFIALLAGVAAVVVVVLLAHDVLGV